MSYYRAHILICAGTPCLLKGAGMVKAALCREIDRAGLGKEIRVVETGCLGPCEEGPVMVVYPEGVMYSNLKPEDMSRLVRQHLVQGRVVEDLVCRKETRPVVSLEEKDYLARQCRIVLRNCGRIDPNSIQEYIAADGYRALGKVLTSFTTQQVVSMIKESGLRGRGGAGFPTGLKWSFTAGVEADRKYIIGNADEGEPGTFKDRLLMEGDPHSLIEGMAIAGYAVGADRGIIYIRGEYTLSLERLRKAAAQARELGLLGRDIFGTGFNFDLEVRAGAGAYVCGEETALIESLEGKRGEPRLKPPFPGVVGLWGKPTVVNNVETLANIPPIIHKGPEWFRSIGTEKSPGTKVFTMLGNITNRGVIEVPMGTTLREIIYGMGGGIPGGRKFKLAQTGGTSGGCLPETLLDLPMDYDSLAAAGSALGSGAILVIDDSHCIVDVLCCFMKFFRHESCGQCTPCREGTVRLYELLSRLAAGQAGKEDIELLRELCRVMQLSSLCGLGQSAPNAVLTGLQYFGDEIDRHVNGECPAGVCRALSPKLRAV